MQDSDSNDHNVSSCSMSIYDFYVRELPDTEGKWLDLYICTFYTHNSNYDRFLEHYAYNNTSVFRKPDKHFTHFKTKHL
jgi:hypothetical protein